MTRRKSKPTSKQANPTIPPQEQMLARAQAMLSAEDFIRLQQELQQPLFPALRINALKTSPQQAIEDWKKVYGWEVRGIPYCPNGWWVLQSSTPISQTIEHRLGYYYIQDAASMLPVELFDFGGLTHPLILDMAASPGGKTTHLIDRSFDDGLVLANDSSQERITALRLVLQNWGAFHQAVTCFPGEKFGLWFPERFDRVLLDAPCSMQNLRSSEARPVRTISDKERDSLAMRQKRLLSSAFQAVKPGGQVVYSTCTLNPEENEAVLDDLLKRYPGAARVVDVQSRLAAPAPALESFESHSYDAAVRGAARLWPHCFGTSGFFAALIEKDSALGLSAQAHPETSLEKAGFSPLPSSDLQSLVHQFNDLYGFDLQEKVLSRGLVFWQRGESVFAFSERWLRQFSSLPARSAGLLVLERTGDHLAVSHEFAARFGSEFQAGIYPLPDECQAAWLRGEDLSGVTFPEKQRGCVWVMMDGKGRLMGRGKVTARGIKNLLPRRVIYT